MSEYPSSGQGAESTTSQKPPPNILVTGTPGTGKTTLCRELALRCGPRVRHLCVSEIAKESGYLDGWDEETQCHFLDEDRLLDDLEERLADGGCVVDYHSAELFPERWFQAVFVLRTENSTLYQRLKARNYSDAKVQQNVQCEIFQVLLDEAREAYRPEIVRELASNTAEDLENNLTLLMDWLAGSC